jgi:hypothetical protein
VTATSLDLATERWRHERPKIAEIGGTPGRPMYRDVFAGPSLSRGHVYIGGGNTLFSSSDYESYFPKQYTGTVRCFGLP